MVSSEWAVSLAKKKVPSSTGRLRILHITTRWVITDNIRNPRFFSPYVGKAGTQFRHFYWPTLDQSAASVVVAGTSLLSSLRHCCFVFRLHVSTKVNFEERIMNQREKNIQYKK
jgi:hypothetical protein